MGWARTVRIRSAGQTYTKYNNGKSGYLAQSVLPLYFGLGDATKIDRLEVDWPSGQKLVLTTGLEENQTLQIAEPTVNSRTEPQSVEQTLALQYQVCIAIP